jgi:ElaB/YqjD/DUF883 family membrane-anchored ribosome-binding protein
MNNSHFETSLEALQVDHTRALSESAESRAKAEAEARERAEEEMEKVREELRVAKRERRTRGWRRMMRLRSLR